MEMLETSKLEKVFTSKEFRQYLKNIRDIYKMMLKQLGVKIIYKGE